MSTRRSPVRPIAIALMIVAILAFFLLRPKPEEKPPEEVTPVAEPEPEEEEAPEPPKAPEQPAPTPQPAPTAAADEAQPAAPVEAPSQDGGPLEPLSPPLREHALLMITPMAKMAMESGDVTQLKALRDMLNERKEEKLMGAADMEALELSIGCLERSPEAREEARDLIEFGTPTAFGESFAKACGR